ncbi:hypothetical protein A2704_03750 [Candidatus Kaiserbacteria bacterium RIFCSPHIGHO2_01_FULL_54_36b]|uniref:Thymidylate kinase-like domain-containing protein n=1 Tax=Candidatus Kaiserbacteria bacterium RIFCSPHIGHO2_01_FULL_54_36b TaxID=1798483 RepID=A0A1F6CQ94_9BACT|nr:MAG: hypothetical protein A2704_03750 [Candidatus Kaiserbacteria bacterium RIFCSPHIGHO2_01_FULL_54_36b]
MNPFICLEGVDAVGKTEVAKCLATRLGHSYYKSPGEPFASVRKMVDESVDPLTRYFFYRSATQHDSKCIASLLATSGLVCDRYIYSTFAFHGAMDPLIQSLFELTGLRMPDHTFLLVTREEVRARRLQTRLDANALDLNIALQRRADRIFRTFGLTVIDTSDTTVEEAAGLILAQLGSGS